jgi:hypothetical protein
MIIARRKRPRLLQNSIRPIQISFTFPHSFALIIHAETLEAVSPLRADLKSAIWPHAAGISRKVGTKAAGHGLSEELMARTNGNGSSTKSKSPSAKKLSPQQKIAQRAYEIYLERNGAPGNPLDDWVRAERELLQKSRKSTKKTAAAAA